MDVYSVDGELSQNGGSSPFPFETMVKDLHALLVILASKEPAQSADSLRAELLSRIESDENYKPQWEIDFYDYIDHHKRFLYSTVSSWICTNRSKDKFCLGSMSERILYLYDRANTENKIVILKLYDHVHLAIQQVNYIDTFGEGVIDKTRQNAEKSFKDEIKKTKKDFQNRIKAAEKSYISILGIFAAIVLACIGGIVFSTSVLSHMHEVSIYRAVIMSLIIGLVTIDILHFLFYCIGKCSQYEKSSNLDVIEIQHQDEKNFILYYIKLICRIVVGALCFIKKHTVFFINTVFVLLIIATYCAWHEGYVEERNARICSQYPQEHHQEQISEKSKEVGNVYLQVNSPNKEISK